MTPIDTSTPGSGTPERRVPDFFIVGQPKSGTTALYEMLRQHPQIYMPGLKEPDFFLTDLPDRHPDAEPRHPQTLDEYLALFAGAAPDQRAGEASVAYFRSREAARGIKALQPAARIIVIVREPTSLLSSLHLQLVQNHDEPETSFQKALELEADRSEGRRIPASVRRPGILLYSEHVKYVTQLRRYHDAFGTEQVLVLVYDDFRRNPEGTVREVLRFLDVDEAFAIEPLEANPTVRLRSKVGRNALHRLSAGNGPISGRVKAVARAVTPQGARRRALEIAWGRIVYGPPRPADRRVKEALQARYKPEVVALSEYIRRDLVKLWDYDNVG